MKASIQRHIQHLENKCANLAVKVNQIERLLAKVRPIVAQIEAIENGTASPIQDDAEYVLNDWLIETVRTHCEHCRFIDATDYIGGYSVNLAKMAQDLSEAKDDLVLTDISLSVWKS